MTHIHEKIDFTTTICIVHENKTLLIMHKKLNVWLQPGGHVELDEDPNESAIREVKEETGLDVELVGRGRSYEGHPANARELILPKFMDRHYFGSATTHEHIDLCFFARPTSDVANVRHEIEGGQIHWFTKEELEGNEYKIYPDVRAHALAALEELRS